MQSVRDTLAAFDDVQVEQRLHDVPPHEVWAVTVDGQRAVCKRNTGPAGRAAIEGRVTLFVDCQTSIPTPRVLWVGADAFLTAWDEHAPTPGSGEPSEAWARAAGRGLARLHAETADAIDGYGQFVVSDAAGPLTTGNDQLSESHTEIADNDDFGGADSDDTVAPDDFGGADSDDLTAADNDDLTAVGLTTTDASTAREWAIEYVEGFWEILAANGHADLADRVQSAFTDHPELFADADTGAVCHGWATPEHVAVRGDSVSSMIDFEHATAAPAAFDYLRATLPTFDGGAPNRAFRDGYTSVRSLSVDRDDPGYRLCWLVSLFDSLYVQNAHPPEEIAERADRLRTAIDETLARID